MKRLNELRARFDRLLKGILPRQTNTFAVSDIPLPVAALLAAGLKSKRVLIITATPALAEQLVSDSTLLLSPLNVLTLSPADDEAALVTGERVAQVKAILSPSEPSCVITSIHALLQPIPTPSAIEAASLTFSLHAELPFETLAQSVSTLGYHRCELVNEPLAFALRGGIFDLWPAGAIQPIRVEFFGDTIESLRLFDPMTQCSISKLQTVSIPPAPSAKLKTTQLLPSLRESAVVLFDHPSLEAALLQLPLVSHSKTNRAWFTEQLAKFSGPVCFTGEPLRAGIPSVAFIAHPIEGVRERVRAKDKQAPDFYTRIRSQLLLDLDERTRKKETVVLCAESSAALELLSHELPTDSKISLLCAPLSQGFRCDNLKLTIVAQSDLYPTRRTWRAPTSTTKPIAGQRLEYAFDVEPGELVVHLEHGIGKFLGLTEIELDGQRTEVFTLEYAGGAKLHVPTTHAHLLSRYIGPHPKKTALHSLDGNRWQKEKSAAQQGIMDLAVGLLETQAKRRVMSGFSYDLSEPWIAEFEALFPYQETPDQARVIAEIKADMSAPIVMDRLLCGDAGYGKTEIAMRAAFITVMNHRQVAVLAPTTVLAEQHYETFCDRMANFPVRIDVLSRFRTQGQRTATREAVARGEIDILIGTHALLSDNVPFKELGLLVIDEEQRFGVVHKERLKSLRALVDVLTMSATPIPRTLYLSLTGARDLSLLQTPPQNRVAVETIIQRDDDALIAAAIRKELARGGQVFYLYNRVMTIGRVFNRVRTLVPEAKIAIAHGQMPANELAETMHAFEQGEVDVLICTTIIGSGIDIPRANTILIDRADRFGLADLYQLRGRVGRSIVKGFAYLLLPSEGLLDSDGRQRLQALKRHSGLGSGYNIALRDLEIRGSGNLLGAAQSGHIAAIGFGLYCQLLHRTVARLKGDAIPLLVEVELSFDFINSSPGADGSDTASLPYGYIDDEAQRMNAYRRSAEAASLKEINVLEQELTDRYGAAPLAVSRYFRLARLRILAAEKRLCKIEVREGFLTCFTKLNHAPLRGYTQVKINESSADRCLDFIEARLHRL
ncbi:MAG: transcription-repair coupling factor [Kiritimatiellia bacterium]